MGFSCFSQKNSTKSHLYNEGVNTPLIRYHAIVAAIAQVYFDATDDDGFEGLLTLSLKTLTKS